MIIELDEIQKLIPHRYPFLLIDRIQDVVLGEKGVGVKGVTFNEWYFQGHFPGYPIMPGVLIIEAMAQTAGTLVVKTLVSEGKKTLSDNTGDNVVYFMSIDEAKFRKPVVPGDMLYMHVTKERSRGTIWRFRGEAKVNDTLMAEATFTAMIVDK
jgi:3-hydroxyacyl-[acyl-carrier-protein] dehydratase